MSTSRATTRCDGVGPEGGCAGSTPGADSASVAYAADGGGAEGRVVAATETITVLFTDLVGSTELASALTSEAADQLRRSHFGALRRAIVPSGGTEVKNLGDGLMVVFPSTSAALSCAVAMVQTVDRENATAPRPLGLRVGLSGGEATREADDFFGDPVVEAARLCARAGAGQILATDAVRVMVGIARDMSSTDSGRSSSKGCPSPSRSSRSSGSRSTSRRPGTRFRFPHAWRWYRPRASSPGSPRWRSWSTTSSALPQVTGRR